MLADEGIRGFLPEMRAIADRMGVLRVTELPMTRSVTRCVSAGCESNTSSCKQIIITPQLRMRGSTHKLSFPGSIVLCVVFAGLDASPSTSVISLSTSR